MTRKLELFQYVMLTILKFDDIIIIENKSEANKNGT